MSLFNKFNHLPESLFCNVIEKRVGNKAINKTEALFLGKLITQNNWKKAQKLIIDKFSKYNNLGLAIQAFEGIGFWNQASLFRRGYTTHSITSDDWWREFTNLMIDLYPVGINDNRIWERSDGDLADFSLLSSPKEQWWDAMKKLKNGGGKTNPRKLLQEVQRDNPRNEHVQILNKIYNNH